MSGRKALEIITGVLQDSSANNTEPSPIDKHGNYYTRYMILLYGIGYVLLFCGLFLLVLTVLDPTALEGAGLGIHISIVVGLVWGLNFIGKKYTLTSDALIIQKYFMKRVYPLDQLREDNVGAAVIKHHSMIFMYKGRKIKVTMPIMQGGFDFAERVAKAVGLAPGSAFTTYRRKHKEETEYQLSQFNKKATKSQTIGLIIIVAIALFVLIASQHIMKEHTTAIAQEVFSQYSDKYSSYFTLLTSSIMSALSPGAAIAIFLFALPVLVEKDYRYKSVLWVSVLICFVLIMMLLFSLDYDTYVAAYNDYSYVKNDAPLYIVTEKYSTDSEKVGDSTAENTQRVYTLTLYHEDGTKVEAEIPRSVYARLQKGKYRIEAPYLPNLGLAIDWEITPIEKEDNMD